MITVLGIDFGLAGLFTKVITFIVALLFVYFMMWMFDRTDKVDHVNAFDKIETDPRALADYFGWRILAFCVLGGLVFS